MMTAWLREALRLANESPFKDDIRFAPGLAGGRLTLDADLQHLPEEIPMFLDYRPY